MRFVSPPDLGTVSLAGTASGLGSATGLWPDATDADPAGATKPVYAVPWGTENLVYVGAVTTRLQFGNMQSRFAPEQVSAATQVTMEAAAREQELNLLTQIAKLSKALKFQPYLGAARDILSGIDATRSQYLYPHRIPRSATLTVAYPEWVKDLIKADLAREVAHDNSGPFNVLAISDAEIDDLFTARGVRVIWTMDGLEAGTYGSGNAAIPSQNYTLLTAGSGAEWPGQTGQGTTTVVVGLMWIEGTIQFLDGGQLDLGVVRDSLLDSTNDWECFTETFEAIAMRGLEVFQLQHTVKPTGGSAGTNATSGYTE